MGWSQREVSRAGRAPGQARSWMGRAWHGTGRGSSMKSRLSPGEGTMKPLRAEPCLRILLGPCGEGGDRARISIVDALGFFHLGHTSQCQQARSMITLTLPRDGPSEVGERMPTGPWSLLSAQRMVLCVRQSEGRSQVKVRPAGRLGKYKKSSCSWCKD